jgi:leader peptidase (prepilin peptidase)/N-methyltransferase
MSVAYVAALPSVFGAVFGAVFGSFLNVVIWRLPRGESLATPASHCPSCDAPVRPFDNVPVLSWLLLRGRCRHCHSAISRRYPLVELLTAVLMALVPVFVGTGPRVWLGLVLVALLVPIAFIDLDHQIIPNKLTLPGAILGIALTAALVPDALVEHLIAGAAGALFLFVALMAYPAGMGMGDVKLAGVMGLFLGRAVGPAMLIALLTGTIVGVAVMAAKGVAAGRKTRIPFGPSLAFGGIVGLFAGDAIVDWYLDTFV